MRKIIWVVVCAAAACQSTAKRSPEGFIDTNVHPDYGAIRPVVVAVLPDEGSNARPEGIRQTTYNWLFHKRYSPLALSAVDARTSTTGEFDARDLDWDAKLRIRVDSYAPLAGTNLAAANANATLVHRTGETLWECSLRDYPLPSDEEDNAGTEELVKTFLSRLPDCPPLRAPDVVSR